MFSGSCCKSSCSIVVQKSWIIICQKLDPSYLGVSLVSTWWILIPIVSFSTTSEFLPLSQKCQEHSNHRKYKFRSAVTPGTICWNLILNVSICFWNIYKYFHLSFLYLTCLKAGQILPRLLKTSAGIAKESTWSHKITTFLTTRECTSSEVVYAYATTKLSLRERWSKSYCDDCFSECQSKENRGKECHWFWLRLRHRVILISNVRTSASKEINRMALIWAPTVITTALERTKEKFYGFRQTETSKSLESPHYFPEINQSSNDVTS